MRIQRKYAMNNTPFAAEAEATFREFVLRPEFPCLGAKAALNSDWCSLQVFAELGSAVATTELAAALYDFTPSKSTTDNEYATFAAIFEGPRELDEIEFENLLWGQLRAMRTASSRSCRRARRRAIRFSCVPKWI
jgi:uncharacterized protein